MRSVKFLLASAENRHQPNDKPSAKAFGSFAYPLRANLRRFSQLSTT